MINKLTKKTHKQKMDTHFGVKLVTGSKSIKEIDMDNRTVKFVANTYFFIDSDLDMLVTGCATKSINDRGPQSNAVAKIKHQSDHVLNTKNVVGRLTVLDERVIDGLTVLYGESHIAPTRKGNDDLINYQDGIYDNHSVGFRYKLLVFAEKDSANELSRQTWDEFYPKALNPEVADEHGFFWVVKEIELFEISVVSYGANTLTPVIDAKSKDASNRIKTDLFERIDNLHAQLKSSAATKEDQTNLKLEFLQLKQIITELQLEGPSKKDTTIETSPSNNDTTEEAVPTKSFIQKLNRS